MNSTYKLVFSAVLNAWVAVAEHVRGRGKQGTVRLLSAAAVLAGGALGTMGTAWAQAGPPPAAKQLPTGAQVAAGSVSISQSQTATAASMAINQSSAKAIVNWQTFNVGANAKVNITQPSSTSVLLNRVQSSDPSQIFGQIQANGQVFLTNPNGVYFAPGSSVDVGSFTATTHGISDADFLSGNYQFSRQGATGGILNQGSLTAGLGGYIALLAPEVRNQGVVVAQLGGTVALAAGESYQLQLSSNGQLTNVLVAPATIQTLVDNGNAVQAPGGLIILSAQAASGLLGGVVKNSGAISATGMVSDGGTIRLSASHKIELAQTSSIRADAAANSAGKGGRIDIIADLGNATGITQVDGTISAKGGEQGGDGGFVETSAAKLTIADTVRVSTMAPRGQVGEWLLDPTDFNIAPTGGDMTGAALTTGLASGNVTITSTSGAGGTAGNINVFDDVSWSSNTLTLNSGFNINVGSSSTTGSLTVTGSGSLNLNPSSNTVTGWTAGGAVLMGMATSPTSGLTGGYLSGGSFGAGAATGFNGQINVSTSGTVKISNTSYSVINSEADFVGIASGGNYVIGSQLAFSTNYTAAVVASFGGKLNGFGHVISGLNINNSSASFLGLFNTSNGNVRNLGVTGSIVGGNWVGAISGYTNGLVISRSYSTVAITGGGGNGGLVGLAQPVTISESYATGDVISSVSSAGSMGGLVGYFYGGSITSSYATGAVYAAQGGGGLVGSMQNNSSISNSFATGNVTAMFSNNGSFGGLVGYIPATVNATITNSYASGAVNRGAGVTGITELGGLTGSINGGVTATIFVGNNYWNSAANSSFNVSTGGTGNGTVFSAVSALSASQMKSAANFSSAFGSTSGAFTTASGWGYHSGLNGGFPVLCAITACTAYDSSLMALTYNGAANGLWSVASNWLVSGTSTVASFAPTSANAGGVSTLTVNSGSIVDYDTASVGSLNVPIANDGNITFTGGSNVSITGVISGTGTLTKAGTGTVTLSGANTYTGTTTISAGTLAISHASGLGGTGAGTTVASGATLDLRGVTAVAEAITLSGGTLASSTGAISLTGSVTLGADSTVNVSGTELALAGVVSGGYGMTKTGAGTLVLSNSNSYTGGTTILAGTVARGADGAFGTGTVTVDGGAADLRGVGVGNNFILGAGGPHGALTSSTAGEVYFTGAISLSANSSIGGDVANNIVFFGPVTGNGYGLVLLDRITKLFVNSNNTLSTIATGPAVGGMNVINNQALSIGQVVLGGTSYSGIDSMGTVAVSTRTGDLTISQNVSTTSTSNNGNAPAIDLRAGTLTAAGTVTGGDLVLSGNPSFSMGANALAVFYSGNSTTTEATALISNLSANTPFDKVYNRDSNSNIFGSGYWAAFRGSAPVTIYLLPVSGQSSTYGTAPTALDYCYSSSAASCVNVSYSGIPSTSQSFALGSGAVSGAVNVTNGVSGSLALTGSPSIAASGLHASTDAGTYALTLTPSLTLPGYNFSAGNAVNYTVNRRTVSLTNTARTTTYDGVSTYAALANGTSYTVSGLVGSDALASVTQTPRGQAGSALGLAQAGSFSATPSAAVLSTGNSANYNFIYVDSTHTVNKANATVTANSATVTYNGANQTVSGFSATGLVGGETQSVLTGVSASRTAKNAGSYAVTPSGLDANYNLSFVDGALVINKANATVTANSGTVTYNGANQTVSGFTASGLVGGETEAALTGVSASRTAKNAGTYVVTPSGLDANYNLSFVDGALVINKANATVTGNSGTVTYNGANQTVSGFTASGLVGGETEAALTGVSASRTAKNAGTYVVTPSGLDANYNLTFVDGAMVIQPAALTLTATTNTKSFDGNTSAQAVPMVSGLQGNDSVTNVSEAYADANPGNGKTLRVQGGYRIEDGNSGANYSVVLVDDSSGVIRSLPVAVLPPAVPVNSPVTVEQPSVKVATAGNVSSISSPGVSVNTISQASQQTPGLVAVLVPLGTATAGVGLVIALPGAVVAPAQDANVSVSVTLPDRQPLPSWIRYDASTQSLITTAVPAGAFPIAVLINVGSQSTVVQISESTSGR